MSDTEEFTCLSAADQYGYERPYHFAAFAPKSVSLRLEGGRWGYEFTLASGRRVLVVLEAQRPEAPKTPGMDVWIQSDTGLLK